MCHWKSALRIMSSVMVSMGAFGATSALAQADIAVSLHSASQAVLPDGGSADKAIAFGGARTYTVTVTNTGNADLTDVQVTAALPDLTGVAEIDGTCGGSGGDCTPDAGDILCSIPAQCDPATEPGCVAGIFVGGQCIPAGPRAVCGSLADAGQLFPCSLGNIYPGGSVTLNFAVAFAPIPPNADGSCPDGQTCIPALCTTNFNLSATATASNATTDDDDTAMPIGPDGVTPMPVTNSFADVSGTVFGPDAGKIGDNLTYGGTVTNNGPCDATNVVIDVNQVDAFNTFLPNNFNPSLNYVSATGDCGTFGADGTCTIGTLASGASSSFTTVQQVPSPSTDFDGGTITLSQTAATFGYIISQDQINPNDGAGDNLLSYTTIIKGPASPGCASTGGGTPMGSVLMLGLGAGIVAWLARRRSR